MLQQIFYKHTTGPCFSSLPNSPAQTCCPGSHQRVTYFFPDAHFSCHEVFNWILLHNSQKTSFASHKCEYSLKFVNYIFRNCDSLVYFHLKSAVTCHVTWYKQSLRSLSNSSAVHCCSRLYHANYYGCSVTHINKLAFIRDVHYWQTCLVVRWTNRSQQTPLGIWQPFHFTTRHSQTLTMSNTSFWKHVGSNLVIENAYLLPKT